MVNDVSTLMGKLKANVAYLQFSDSATEEKSTWPVIERMAQALKFDASSQAPAEPAPAAPQPAPAAPAPSSFAARLAAVAPSAPAAAPAAASIGGGILRRYSAPASATQAALKGDATTAEPRALADIFAQLERKAP